MVLCGNQGRGIAGKPAPTLEWLDVDWGWLDSLVLAFRPLGGAVDALRFIHPTSN